MVLRTIIITKDEDGHFVACFEDDPDACTAKGYESKEEAIGTLVSEHSTVFNIQIKEK